MRFDISFMTRFTYPSPVAESQNELRACPLGDDRQHVLHYRVVTSPSARVGTYTDYWGTRVDTFGVRTSHDVLEVMAEMTVETAPPARIVSAPRTDLLEDPAFRDTHVEYLRPSPHADWGPGVAAEARRRADLVGGDLVTMVLALHRSVGTSLTYTPGATYVGVPVDDVLDRGEGVCQDFAHLVIAMCRSLGVPARYVSGYLFAVDERGGTDPDVDEVAVQTHAWVEAAIPEPDGSVRWMPLDPTNQQEVGPRHVKIGHGRDYDDLAPLRGTYKGSATHDLDVAVRMRRSQQQQQQQQ